MASWQAQLSKFSEDVSRLLECPVCTRFMEGTIYQCENGHTVCYQCRPQLGNSCPSCRRPFINTRALTLEHIAEVVCRPCGDGCGARITRAQQKDHAFDCESRKVQCSYCAWNGDLRLLPQHLQAVQHNLLPNFALSRPIPLRLLENFERNWYMWSGVLENAILELRIKINDDGCSWFCARLFGTRQSAKRYQVNIRLESARTSGDNVPSSRPLACEFTMNVHCDLEQTMCHCIPLPNYEALQAGFIRSDGKLYFHCTIF